MSRGQKASAVKRKQQASNTGPKPSNVSTFLKRKNMERGGLIKGKPKLALRGF